MLRELDHDPYHSKLKIREPNVCPECGATFQHGRWSWGDATAGAHEQLCPACQRIRDRVPAAFLTLRGTFLGEHKDEIMHLIHNYEERERKEHPIKRIMSVEEQGDGLVLAFTDAIWHAASVRRSIMHTRASLITSTPRKISCSA